MKFLPEFRNYLFSQKDPSSKVTVKNYTSDIVRFVRWFEGIFNSPFSPESVTPQIIEQFKQSNNLALSSIDRNLSSLRKFFNFLVLEGVISESPLKIENSKLKIEDDPYHLKDFKNYLYVYNASRLTIKNYLMDVRGFFKWLEEVSKTNDVWDIKEKDILSKIDNYLIEEYKRRLPYSPRTMNRKLSSLRKYLKWAKEEGLIAQEENTFEGVAHGQGARQRGDFRSVVSEGKETRKSTPQNSYSKFPPFRLIQKTIRGLVLLPELILIAPLASSVRGVEYLKWKISGKPVIEKVRKSRLIKPVRNFSKETFTPFAISITHFPLHRKLLFHLVHKRPNWYKRYHSYSFTHYLHLALLVVFMSIFGFNIYQNIIQRPNTGVLGVALPLNPPNPRVLSFQGRLTDSSNNPITASTNLRFIIYDDIAASGSALKWQEVDTVTPDSDGVFSVLLGKNTALTQDLFAQHAGLWLGVTVGQTAELTPRQQLATVAFAENTETLQGLPPITQSGAATSNVVLALDSSGNLTIGGSATPTFQATGGKFTLSGNPLLLTTTAGSKANVTIAPDGRSFIDLQKPLQNSTKNNNISSALGAVEVDSLLAVLATSSGQSAFTINQNGAGPIISASSSGLPKFTVDNSGNTTIAGGNFSQTGSGTFSTGTGTVSLNGDSTIASGKNFTVTLGNTSLTSSTTTSNALSLTDTALTSGTGFAKTFTSNAGNGQTTIGESIALTDSTTAGGGYTGLSISTSGSGSGSGNKYLLDLNPGTNKDVVFDSAGAFRPTVAVSSNTNTIGSASFYWKNGFFDQITANTLSGTVAGGSTSSTTWTIGSTQTGDVNEALIFQRNSGSGNATLQWNAGSGDLRYLTANYPFNTTYTVNNTSIGTTIDLLSANLTNNTTSGTQRLLSLTNTGTGTTTSGIYLNNTGTASTGLEIAGIWGTGILTNNNTINAGTGAITSGAITTSGNFSQTGSSTFSTGTGNVSLNGNVLIAANQTVQLSSGTGTITQNYSNNTGTGTTLNITDSASSGTTTVNGLGVALVGTANATGANTLNGLNFSNVTAQTNNTYNALNFGTGYTNFINSGTVNLTAAGALSGLTSVSASGAISTSGNISATGTGTITSAGLLTASNGLTLTTGALNLTATSGSTSITGYGTTSLTSTTASGNILTLADSSFTTTGANLANLTFTNTNAGAGAVTTNGLSITPTGTAITGGGSNTLNAINLPNVTAIASNTFNGVNFGTGYNNLVNSANWTVTAAGAETIAGNFSQTGTTTLSTGTGGISLNGNTTLGSGKTFTWTTGAIDTGGKLGVGTTGPGAQMEVDTGATTTIGQIIKAQASQTADLLQIQNSLAAVIAKVDNLGNITGNTLTSTVAQGTAPLTVTSTTVVANLNAAAAQEPMPNLVLNSDFGRRNKWMTFMPETFTDTSGWTLVEGTLGTVASNILTAGSTGNWRIRAGLSTWRDGRFSAQFKASANGATNLMAAVEKYVSGTNVVGNQNAIQAKAGLGIFELDKDVNGTETALGSLAVTYTSGNWYWLELEAQGTTYIAKLYSCPVAATACSKSSATLVTNSTISGTISDSVFSSGGYIGLYSGDAVASQWGGLATGDGGVYVEGWGPESWTPAVTGGGSAIGFDETADAGPLGKQWAIRTYIPSTSKWAYLISPSIPVTPSTAYSWSGYEKVSGLGGTGSLAFISILEYDINQSYLNTFTSLSDSGETSWTRKSNTNTFTPGASTRYVKILLGANTNGNGNASATGTAYFDLPQLELGSIATPWRNAPADDGPITWAFIRAAGTENTSPNTTSTTYVEANSRDYAANVFLPWDATLRADVKMDWANSGAANSSQANVRVDGSSLDGGSSIDQLIYDVSGTTSEHASTAMTEKGYAAGKHRVALVVATGAGTLTYYLGGSSPTRMIVTATRGKFDLAEEYTVQDTSIEAGDVIRLARNNTNTTNNPISNTTIEKTTGGYEGDVLGIVSTAPGITLSSQVELNSYQNKPNLRPVALKGRVPVKVTNENGPIHRGDTLTSSATYQGYAMKAAKAGPAIGIAMEDFTPSENNPILPISNTTNNQIQTGRVMTFVNLSWYDPDVYLTSTGDFVIKKVQTTTQVASATPNPQTGLYPSPTATASAQPSPSSNCKTTVDSSNFGLVISNCPQTVSTNYTYQIANALGNTVERVGAFSQAVIGTLRVGLIQTKELVADTINVNNKIISPIAEVSQVKTDIITPLASDKVVVKLQDNSATPSATSIPRLEIQNASGSAVAVFDDKGNASLSGQLSAKSASISGNLTTADATISGTLKAKNIIADNIDTQILNLKSQLSNLMPKEASSSAKPIDIASYSAQLASVDTIQAQVGTFMQGLFAVGPSSFSDASVFGQLSVGGNLVLAQNSINVLGTDLKLQSLGQGGVLLGKKIYVDADGNLSVNGDAKFNGTLFANVISPIPGNDLVFKLLNKNATESANFTIQNASGSAVARIDQNGDATFRKLNLSLVSPAFALSSNEVIATGSAGIATISAQFKELTVDNKLVTDKSLIYITPVGTPSAQIPFLLRQVSGESFTVGVEQETETKIPFNWLIIN